MNISGPQNQNDDLSWYIPHILESKYKTSQLFDKSLLTLAGGVFGLSITFVRQIVPDLSNTHQYIMTRAWLFICNMHYFFTKWNSHQPICG